MSKTSLRPAVPVVLIVLASVTGCSTGAEVRSVASPPPDASAPHVVQAFIDGVNAGDDDLVRDLVLDGGSSFQKWLDEGWELRDAKIEGAREVTLDVPATDDPTRTEVVVTFDPSNFDDSYEAGQFTTWRISLVLDDGRWFVANAGVA